ncbi:MAG: B12-binding domain-containing radical SAM protein, partial [Verrucomicrobiota bacterium]
LYDRLLAAGRIFDIEDIDRWPGQNCYIRPPYGTPGTLERNIQTMYRDFYSLRSMFKRLPLPVTQSNIASWVINFSQRRMAQIEQSHNNFDGY